MGCNFNGMLMGCDIPLHAIGALLKIPDENSTGSMAADTFKTVILYTYKLPYNL